jgi:Recombinase
LRVIPTTGPARGRNAASIERRGDACEARYAGGPELGDDGRKIGRRSIGSRFPGFVGDTGDKVFGPLAYLLRNRFYIGEVVFKGEVCPAEHPPILDTDLFEAVQQKLAQQRNGYRVARASSNALLMGRIFDDRGNRMSPSHSRKGATRHRYYVSSALIQGRPQTAGSVARVPAVKIEAAIVGQSVRTSDPMRPATTPS